MHKRIRGLGISVAMLLLLPAMSTAVAGSDTNYNWATSPASCYMQNHALAATPPTVSTVWSYSNCFGSLRVDGRFWNGSWYGPYVALNNGTRWAQVYWYNFAGGAEGWHTATDCCSNPTSYANHTYATNP